MITINYENTIDNIYELDKNQMPLFFWAGSQMEELILNDPRQVMGRIINLPMPKLDEEEQTSMDAILNWMVSQYVVYQSDLLLVSHV